VSRLLAATEGNFMEIKNGIMEITLSKGKVIEVIKHSKYLIRDVFTDSEILAKLTGKESMIYKYEIGEVVYYAMSNLNQKLESGKLITATGFKYYQNISMLKEEVDKKYRTFLDERLI
jgi:hypothetical protein